MYCPPLPLPLHRQAENTVPLLRYVRDRLRRSNAITRERCDSTRMVFKTIGKAKIRINEIKSTRVSFSRVVSGTVDRTTVTGVGTSRNLASGHQLTRIIVSDTECDTALRSLCRTLSNVFRPLLVPSVYVHGAMIHTCSACMRVCINIISRTLEYTRRNIDVTRTCCSPRRAAAAAAAAAGCNRAFPHHRHMKWCQVLESVAWQSSTRGGGRDTP